MAKLCRKLKWLVFFWDTVYICQLNLITVCNVFAATIAHKFVPVLLLLIIVIVIIILLT